MDQKNKKQWIVLIVSLAAVLGLSLLLWPLSRQEKKDNSHSFAVYITEILSSNKLYPDAYGHFHDYVELYNSADGDIDISGFKLTDSQRDIGYVIPEGTILRAHEYYFIWCEADTDEDIANFSISKSGGEVIYLMNRKNVTIDSVSTIRTKTNMPMILNGSNWTISSFATPGFPNTQEGYQAYLQSHSASSFPIRINEVVSSNTRYNSPNGLPYDYIELINLSSAAVDLSGCRLSDDPEKIKYSFPEGTIIEAGEIMILWCDEMSGLPFKISSTGGETVVLTSPGGDLIDTVEIPPMESNLSYARLSDDIWGISEIVTPGFPNSEEGFEAYLASQGVASSVIHITEVMADNVSTMIAPGVIADWIELTNDSEVPQDLTGWWLSDNEENPQKWCIPSLTIPSCGRVIIACDGLDMSSYGLLHTSFSLSRFGETLTLSSPNGVVMDTFVYGESSPDASYIYGSDGEPEETDMITPGFENTASGFLAYQETLIMPSSLCISEVMTANDNYLQQRDNKYYDWVEVYNNTSSDIDLSDYYLSDALDDLTRYRLPAVILPADSYYTIVLVDGTLGLNAQEDWLYLSRNGEILDLMHMKGIPYRHSFGRSKSEGGFFYFASPTPGDKNDSGFRTITSSPTASKDPGIYNDIESITLTLSGPGKIYYTTDGSWPSIYDTLYEEPIELTKTTVIRAICVQEGCLKSDTITLPYFINENHTLPVVSLTLNNSDLYGSSGIITYAYSDMEKYANVGFYNTDGTSFNLDCGVTLFGSMSRETNPKKSFKLLFRPRYGASSVHYDLYDNPEISEFHSLVLRNGQDYPISFIREEMMTTLVQDCSDTLMTTQTRYVILYLNGKYYGIFALKEAFSTNYYASHTGYPEETCRCVRVIDVFEKTPDLYQLMVWAEKNDLSDPENYAYMTENLEVSSLIDWIIFEAYCANNDILNNVRYLHSSEDGKWRYAFYDLDWCMYYHTTAGDPLQVGQQFSMIPRAMMENPEFKDQFLTRMAYLLQTTLSAENVINRIDELCESIAPEMERERATWGSNVEAWHNRVDYLKDFVGNGRDIEMVEGFADYLGLSSQEIEYYFGDIIHE